MYLLMPEVWSIKNQSLLIKQDWRGRNACSIYQSNPELQLQRLIYTPVR